MQRDCQELFQMSENECRQNLEEDFYLRASDNQNTLHYNKPSMQLCARYAHKHHLSLKMTEPFSPKEVRLLPNKSLKEILFLYLF